MNIKPNNILSSMLEHCLYDFATSSIKSLTVHHLYQDKTSVKLAIEVRLCDDTFVFKNLVLEEL